MSTRLRRGPDSDVRLATDGGLRAAVLGALVIALVGVSLVSGAIAQDAEAKIGSETLEITADAWRFADADAWKITDDGKLVLDGASAYRPPYRAPRAVALYGKARFEDFTLDLEMAQTGRDYGHRDLCLFLGWQDPARFYYVHLATKADAHAHNIFLVDGGDRRAIGKAHTTGVDWGKQGSPHSVRLERRGATIRVFFDGSDEPVLSAKDGRFRSGFIGVGSFDDTGEFRDLRIQFDDAREVKSAKPFSAIEPPIKMEIGGKPFAELRYSDQRQPILWPILGPHAVAMTRSWPMKKGPSDAEDHPHHRSLWFAHGEVNGIDFWSEAPGCGSIRQDRIHRIVRPELEFLTANCSWLAPDGTVVCRDQRVYAFHEIGMSRILDFDIEIEASEGDLHFGDTKEGTFAIRVAPELRLEGKVATGKAVNSEGIVGKAAWGKRAAWVDYSGTIDEHHVGVAIFDHPSNLRHPTRWHARAYGLFAANPFGLHHFEGAPKGTGDLVVTAGEKIKFRYRVVFHEGDAESAGIAAMYRDWIGG